MISLKLADIDSSRMVIRVEQGPMGQGGRKDRYAMLADPLLDILPVWWLAGHGDTTSGRGGGKAGP